MNIKQELENYIPFNEQEIKDKEYFLKCIASFDDVLTRNNEFVHFSSSSLILNKEKTKMLVVYHNIYDGWVYPGGHADGEENLISVAIREAKEETGQDVKVLDNSIFAIQSCPVKCHIKKGNYISAHAHLDVVYIFEADEHKALSFRKDESKGIKWIPLEEAYSADIVDFIRPVNQKLIEKLNKMK